MFLLKIKQAEQSISFSGKGHFPDLQCCSFLRYEQVCHIHLFKSEQLYLFRNTACISCQATVTTYNPVAGYNNTNRIVSHRISFMRDRDDQFESGYVLDLYQDEDGMCHIERMSNQGEYQDIVIPKECSTEDGASWYIRGKSEN